MTAFMDMGWNDRWHVLARYARQALEGAGYEFAEKPAFGGKSIVWLAKKDDRTKKVAVRTSSDRHLSFNRSATGWTTLDDVDEIVMATYDRPLRKGSPHNVEIYVFPASEVRSRLDKNYKARLAAGHKSIDWRGHWIALDYKNGDSASYAGCGLALDFKPIRVYPLDEPESPEQAQPDYGPCQGAPGGEALASPTSRTIAEILAGARKEIAQISGLPEDRVSLRLELGAG